jgi:hypothetical protein
MPAIVTAAAKDAEMDDEKCEWRFFMPVAGPDRLPVDSLGELFEGLTEREGPEERDDVYVVVTNDVGVKRRVSACSRSVEDTLGSLRVYEANGHPYHQVCLFTISEPPHHHSHSAKVTG